MGHEILYCFRCGTRVRTEDLERGRAIQGARGASCLPCASPPHPVDVVRRDPVPPEESHPLRQRNGRHP